MNISEPRATAIAVPGQPERAWIGNLSQGVSHILSKTATWATTTAQQFGALLSTLMGPAIVCGYAVALWSLAANLGWTDTFIFASGPLSNWLIWLGFAVAVHLAAQVLKRHVQPER